jgi:hypothetical protein
MKIAVQLQTIKEIKLILENATMLANIQELAGATTALLNQL